MIMNSNKYWECWHLILAFLLFHAEIMGNSLFLLEASISSSAERESLYGQPLNDSQTNRNKWQRLTKLDIIQYKHSTRIPLKLIIGVRGRKPLRLIELWHRVCFTYSLIEIILNCLRMSVEGSEVMMIFFLDFYL